MRLSSRRSDDADVIRARLRVLLDERPRAGGWVPDDPDDPDDEPGEEPSLRDPDPEDPDDAALPSGIGRHRTPEAAVRLDPGRRGARSLWIAGVLAALLLAGWTWLDRPRVEPVEPAGADAAASSSESPGSPSVGEAAETATTVVVSVVGLVARPGLVTLPTGARVADAVEAAGGFLPEADPASVNLAAVVTDGQQVAVGVPGAATEPAGAAPAGGSLNLNTATEADLDALPGIGPVLAQRILTYREQQGRFTTVEQLDDVPGIGPSIYAQLKDLVSV
ncbi:helix-hairpin-helix domain-containing protein [Geodermatophilus sp. URMC 64]